ncbi:MAG: M23 family metallopeptidase [Oscillospiraceae bacterium]|nr:M23 family metallopeptidase [Oscillospiraceae bacterium]
MEEKKFPPRKVVLQLAVSLLILGGALVTRWFYPEETRAFIRRYISGGLDYTAVLSDMGESLRTFVMGVPYPDETVNSGQMTDNGPDTEHGGPGIPPEEIIPEPSPSVTPDDGQLPAGVGGVRVNGLGGLEMPVRLVNAAYFPAFEDGGDDTLPIPFGTVAPDKADFSLHELPFTVSQPANGAFSSGFGYRIHPIYGDWRFHFGYDIAGYTGADIRAFADGTVAAVGVSGSYGNYIILQHADGYVTLYAHCDSVSANEGRAVSAGDTIAKMGSTGVSTGPHLHFELRREESFLDPAPYLTTE